MTKRKIILWSVASVFIIFEAVLFCLIHFVRPDTDFNMRYASIVGAVVFSWLTLGIELILAKVEKRDIKDILFSKTNGNLIRIAMLFTLVADFFMVALDKVNNLAGVTVFLGTQLFICLHIIYNEKNKKVNTIQIIIRYVLSLILICVVGVILGKSTDLMSIISTVYYANLCINAAFAHRSGKGGIMLTIGLVLFALCDINVGLAGLDSIYGGSPEGSLLYNLLNADIDLIWVFYIPSQTLIPLTLLLRDE